MLYNITVEKLIENPDFDKHLAEYKEATSRGYGYSGQQQPLYPDKNISLRVLSVELTEEEYEAVKKSVLSTFK
jgi:hypothetical protein